MKKSGMNKLLSLILCFCLVLGWIPVRGVAEENQGVCPNHPVHGDCGYVEAECSHDCQASCTTFSQQCNHACDETCVLTCRDHGEGCEDCALACSHECTVESGCLTAVVDCQHQHDEACGYLESTPCGHTCELCQPGDSEGDDGDDGVDDDVKVCTCETDEPECHATFCDLYVAPAEPQCYCVEKCTAENLNLWCDVCGVQGPEACGGGQDQGVVYACDHEGGTSIADGICTVCKKYGWCSSDGSVVWTLTGEGSDTLTISGSGATADYSEDSPAPWNAYKDSITDIVIESGVTKIGAGCFQGISLTSMTLPEPVPELGDNAAAATLEYYGGEGLWHGGARLKAPTDYMISFDNTSWGSSLELTGIAGQTGTVDYYIKKTTEATGYKVSQAYSMLDTTKPVVTAEISEITHNSFKVKLTVTDTGSDVKEYDLLVEGASVDPQEGGVFLAYDLRPDTKYDVYYEATDQAGNATPFDWANPLTVKTAETTMYAINLEYNDEQGDIYMYPDGYEGETIEVPVSPAEGYALYKLTVKTADGTEVQIEEVYESNGLHYYFTMPADSVTVKATFRDAKKLDMSQLPDRPDQGLGYSYTKSDGNITVYLDEADFDEVILEANTNIVFVTNGTSHIGTVTDYSDAGARTWLSVTFQGSSQLTIDTWDSQGTDHCIVTVAEGAKVKINSRLTYGASGSDNSSLNVYGEMDVEHYLFLGTVTIGSKGVLRCTRATLNGSGSEQDTTGSKGFLMADGGTFIASGDGSGFAALAVKNTGETAEATSVIDLPEGYLEAPYKVIHTVDPDRKNVTVDDGEGEPEWIGGDEYDTINAATSLHLSKPKDHVHDWSSDWTKTESHHWHDCKAKDCPITKNADKQGYDDHDFGEWKITRFPTESRRGEKQRTCADCGYVQVKKLSVITENPPTGDNILVTVMFMLTAAFLLSQIRQRKRVR